jgi:hypothetical protein
MLSRDLEQEHQILSIILSGTYDEDHPCDS